LGEQDFGICHTEKLLLLNSYALTVGCPENKLPYQVSAPRKSPDAEEEYMGFRHSAQLDVVEVSNPMDVNSAEAGYLSDDNNEEGDVANDVKQEPTAFIESNALLTDTLGDDLDIEVFGSEEEYNAFRSRGMRPTEELRTLDEIELSAVRNEQVNRSAIEQELNHLLPTGTGLQESTIDAFKRLTNQFAWIPFRDPHSSTAASEIDKAESELYDEWMSDPRGARYSPTQYNPDPAVLKPLSETGTTKSLADFACGAGKETTVLFS
jgi:hypothetical protein